MSAKPLTLIVAAAALNNGIGRNNDLPWRIRKDMAFFNKVSTAIASPTTDSAAPVLMNACIMGRRTWESIPKSHRPLDRRYNIIVTSSKDLIPADLPFCATASSFARALDHIDALSAQPNPSARIDRVFVVGGSSIYQEALLAPGHHVQIFLTRVQFPLADTCDTFFPHMDTSRFALQPHERLVDAATFDVPAGVQTSESGLQYEFLLYEATN